MVWTGLLLAADFLWASEHTLLSTALREPVLMLTALGWQPKTTLYIESESRKKSPYGVFLSLGEAAQVVGIVVAHFRRSCITIRSPSLIMDSKVLVVKDVAGRSQRNRSPSIGEPQPLKHCKIALTFPGSLYAVKKRSVKVCMLLSTIRGINLYVAVKLCWNRSPSALHQPLILY